MSTGASWPGLEIQAIFLRTYILFLTHAGARSAPTQTSLSWLAQPARDWARRTPSPTMTGIRMTGVPTTVGYSDINFLTVPMLHVPGTPPEAWLLGMWKRGNGSRISPTLDWFRGEMR